MLDYKNESLVFCIVLAFLLIAITVFFVAVVSISTVLCFAAFSTFSVFTVLLLLRSHVRINFLLWDLVAILIIELLWLASIFFLVFSLFLLVGFPTVIAVLLLLILLLLLLFLLVSTWRSSAGISNCIVILEKLVFMLLLL